MKIEERNVLDLLPHPLSYELFGELESSELEDLKTDIAHRGLQHLIELDVHGRVICGSQRLRALRELGISLVQCAIREDLGEDEHLIIEHLIKDNTIRRQLTNQQKYFAAKKLEAIYSVQAENRRKDSGIGRPLPLGTLTGESKGQAAATVGWSVDTLRRYDKVIESGDEDLIEQVHEGNVAITAAAAHVKKTSLNPTRATGQQNELLRSIRFKRQVDGFLAVLKRNPLSDYPDYKGEISKCVRKVGSAVKDWENT